uniref:Uncharacterized protein n=1 Tax=Arundo donax TaxID=35708 RepID=A0A0A8YAK3_ARUDO
MWQCIHFDTVVLNFTAPITLLFTYSDDSGLGRRGQR